MRIICVIDSLDSGGAQRQITMLAELLKKRGHDVRIIAYHAVLFYKDVLDRAGVPVECVEFRGRLHCLWMVPRTIRARKPDLVIAYLPRPSILAELAKMLGGKFRLVVSERSLDILGRRMTFSRRLELELHRFADAVVSNSYAEAAVLREIAPHLSPRISTILNCVDLKKFRPNENRNGRKSAAFRILCIGRFSEEKNYMRLMQAVEIIARENPTVNFRLDAYGSNLFVNGKPGRQSGCYLKLNEALKRSKVRHLFQLHAPVRDVVPLYQGASALCLASTQEGCSNVVGEAMACGTPVLAARVGDNCVLVKDGSNGLLFDPSNPRDIANAILQFCSLLPDERVLMGISSRQRAERLLAPRRFIEQYEKLIQSICDKSHNRPAIL